jgi:glutamate formiminotransferase / 5-formyltetrahydrofolate cyclo-ligase
MLLAVPNVSEGRDPATVAAIGDALADGAGARLLDVHSDPDHHRSVLTIAGHPGGLADALLRGARAAVQRIDVVGPAAQDPAVIGQHPHVGAVDVVPLVYLGADARGAACAEALVVADRIGEQLEVPVFIYGELSGSEEGTARTRAQLRRGGVAGLVARMADTRDPLRPDFGPPRMHPSAGATLVSARPPLVAFNLQLARGAGLEDARTVAASIREGARGGLPGVRAIGIALEGGVAQVSMNVERPYELPLAVVVEAVRARAQVASAELVGLAPAAALDGFPQDIAIVGFDPGRQLIENALGC